MDRTKYDVNVGAIVSNEYRLKIALIILEAEKDNNLESHGDR